MNAKTLANHYSVLTPEERFRLTLAAIDRGDEAEQGRLKNAAGRITVSNVDYSHYAHALTELATLVFLDLSEEAAKCRDAFEHWSDGEMMNFIDDKNHKARRKRVDDINDRSRDLFLANGFLLKVKSDGWKLFCERLSISPFVLWQYLPGFKRLKRELDVLDGTSDQRGPAFSLVGMLKWLNRTRAADLLEATEVNIVSAARFADSLEAAFRERAEWWGRKLSGSLEHRTR